MTYLLIALAIIAVLIVGIYNSLVKLKNKCEEAWSDIDTQLKRRYDLIPNLVQTVKGYAQHESQTFEKVTEARSNAMNAQGVHEKEVAENMLSSALKSIFALAENYPELKANQNFLELQSTLTEIEEHIQLSRRYYNATVRDLNTKMEVFPNNLIAGPFGFTKREFFQIDEEEKQNVKVSFNETPEMEKSAETVPAESEMEKPAEEVPAEPEMEKPDEEAPVKPEMETPTAAETPEEKKEE
jgi:LemA protein